MRMTLEQVLEHQRRTATWVRPCSPAQPDAKQPKPTSRSKYAAVAVEIDGIRFASKLEGARYRYLKLLERAGEISGLELQPRFALRVQGVHVATYVADFSYHDSIGTKVVEDAKGFITRDYRLKCKLFNVLYSPLVITEIRKCS